MELYLYKWKTSSKDTCEKCNELDGKAFKNNEIPKLPHPNCKCTVEKIQNPEALEILEKEHEELIKEIEISNETQKGIQETIAEFYQKLITPKVKQTLNIMYWGLTTHLKGLKKAQGTLAIFIKEYATMIDANTIGADKFYHARANAQAAQKGKFGELQAIALSKLREEVLNRNDSQEDKDADYEANAIGRKIGRENPDANMDELTKKIEEHGIDTSGAKPQLGAEEAYEVLYKRAKDNAAKFKKWSTNKADKFKKWLQE